jgi:hypothetical protein
MQPWMLYLAIWLEVATIIGMAIGTAFKVGRRGPRQ